MKDQNSLGGTAHTSMISPPIVIGVLGFIGYRVISRVSNSRLFGKSTSTETAVLGEVSAVVIYKDYVSTITNKSIWNQNFGLALDMIYLTYI